MKYIKSINLAITYKCNLKCNHCDIWDNPYKRNMDLADIKNLLSSESIQDGYREWGDQFDIAISGGEPLLVENLYEILEEIDHMLPGSIKSISTNGTLKKELIRLIISMKKIGKSFRKINISIDGSSEIHDLQRGKVGSFQKSIETIQTIKKLFPSQIIEIKLTITKSNFREIVFISKLAKKLGVFFSFKPAENMIHYTNQKGEVHKKFNEDETLEIEKQIINNPYIEEQDYYINKNFFYKIPPYIRNGLGESKKICTIANDSINVMPDGKIYSCILMEQIGDLRSNGLDEIWSGHLLRKQRQDILDGRCPGCMLMCGSFKTKAIYG